MSDSQIAHAFRLTEITVMKVIYESYRNNLYLMLTAGVFVIALLPIIFPSCASTSKTESTGEYIDDAAITAKVKAAILKDPALKITQINVETYKGVVQLSGFVDTREEAKKASNVAAEVAGVVSVKNDLIVK